MQLTSLPVLPKLKSIVLWTQNEGDTPKNQRNPRNMQVGDNRIHPDNSFIISEYLAMSSKGCVYRYFSNLLYAPCDYYHLFAKANPVVSHRIPRPHGMVTL